VRPREPLAPLLAALVAEANLVAKSMT